MTAASGKRVVIAGAGFGGLSAAAYLSAAGAEVTVVERAAHVGGKAALLEKGDFVFDAGPTLLTMPDVMRDVFRAAGSDLDAVAPLTRLDPVARYLFASGAELVVHEDHEKTRASIARFSKRDAAQWDPFFAMCKDIWDVAGEPYLQAPFDGLFGFTQRALKQGSKAMRLGVSLGTLDALARRYFESDEMRAFVGRFATYAGGSPYASTGAFAMIAYLEIAKGAFYPRGGVHALAAHLHRALAARGVRFEFSTEVREIMLGEDARAVGVVTDRGPIRADAVVVNADPLVALDRLLPPRVALRGGLAKLRARTHSLSGFAWSFGVTGDAPADAHHTVIFPRDYRAEFDAIFGEGAICDAPTVYVSVPSLGDPSRAPEGCHSVFTLVNAPPNADPAFWQARTEPLKRLVLSVLERSWCPGIGQRIACEGVVTPCDIAATGSAAGAIYGAAPHGMTATFDRPDARADCAPGLYFVGGATHPGGGVPMVSLSGRFVAEAIASDCEVGRPRKKSALGRLWS